MAQSLLDLPNEIIGEILLYLDHDSQKAVRATNKHLHSLVTYLEDRLTIQNILHADEDNLYILLQNKDTFKLTYNTCPWAHNNFLVEFILSYCDTSLFNYLKLLYKRKPVTVGKIIANKINNKYDRYLIHKQFYIELLKLVKTLEIKNIVPFDYST